MPLNRLILLLLVVIAAAGATIWLVTAVLDVDALPGGWLVGVPIALVVYLTVRALSLRGRS